MNQSRNQNVNVQINKKFKHDLSHQHLTTIDFFRLQPIELMECVAGDEISINIRSLIEASPLATKVYGSAHLDFHAFFVPFRVLWNQWNSYYYGDGSSNTYQVPAVNFDYFSSPDSNNALYLFNNSKIRRSIFGSLGYPVGLSNLTSVGSGVTPSRGRFSILPARAYQQVWWDWFRDSVNIPESDKSSYIVNTSTGWSTSMLFQPRYRSFRKDYITTILTGASAGLQPASGATLNTDVSDTTESATVYPAWVSADGTAYRGTNSYNYSLNKVVESLKIPVLRGAVAMQKFLERLGVTGSRPLERIVSTFGMRPKPERLDMSEFIGYKSIPIGIDGLVNTGSSTKLDGADGVSPFGDDTAADFGTMQGRSSASGQTDTWRYSADEHGYILVMASVVPDYINGNVVDKLFTRGLGYASQGNIDFFQPDFDGQGYQPVLLGEIASPDSDLESWRGFDPAQVVGYHPYAEDYRQTLDRISGDFNEPASRNYLRNMAFVRDLTDMSPEDVVAGLNLTTPSEADRASFDNHFQVTDSEKDHFILNNYIVIDANRPITSSTLPTELSDISNKVGSIVSKNGIRL